jgi:hypothetical protein
LLPFADSCFLSDCSHSPIPVSFLVLRLRG